MEEKKKSNKGLIVVIIILVITLLSLGGYVLVDKGIIKIGTKEDNKIIEKEDTKGEEQLDINSRLVQTLYNQVTTGITSCQRNWIYRDAEGKEKDEFYAEKATEEEKMNFVGNLLSEKNRIYIDCTNTEIPSTMKSGEWTKTSVCESNKLNYIQEAEYGYTKKYIDFIYKSIFGGNAKVDTNIAINSDPYYVGSYIYIPALDKYILYEIEGGGTCGPTSYNVTIEKAIIMGKELKIYEKEILSTLTGGNDGALGTMDDEVEEEKTSNYIYTFEKESDGMYKFISRIREENN